MATSSAPAKRVLLIGWDAADWKFIEPLLEAGQMPCLEQFISGGVMGNVASLSPMLSPILWTSIATGKHADKHQILGFAEPDDATGNVRPVTSTSRKCKAIWNILSQNGRRAGVINWFASHPAEKINGFVVTDRFAHAVGAPDKPWPAVAGSVHPVELMDTALKTRVHPAATPPALINEFVHDLANPETLKSPKIGQLRMLLAQHSTIHRAATWLMKEQPWDFLGIYYDAIDRIGHAFMEFNPPKMAHVSDADFARFKDVMKVCYRLHDKMLGRLIDLAGPEATVILLSDHGFHSGKLRPKGTSAIKDGQPVAWHRSHGIVAIKGPNIRKDQRVYGASLLDITPTILWLLGMPVAKDMDGKALTQIVEGEPAAVEMVETYEGGESEAADPFAEDPWVVQQTLAQLAALGYIEGNNTDGVAIDRMRNLGLVYLATGRPKLALEQFEKLRAQKPDEKGTRMLMVSAYLALGRLDECERIVREVLTEKAELATAHRILGTIQFRRGKNEEALKHLKQAEKAEPRLPGLHCQIGEVYLRRRRWSDAMRAFKKAISIDSDSAEAHDGLGVALRAMKRPAEAVHEHMLSIGLQHYRPLTHLHLGLALAETGQIDWAIRAFHVSLEQDGTNPVPHRCLAQLYRQAKGNVERAREHRARADELRQKRMVRQKKAAKRA